MRVSRRDSRAVAVRAILTTAVAALGLAPAPTATEASEPGTAGVESLTELTRPHVLDGAVAEVILRVRGTSVCSGTPIIDTRLVITAAHCVLDQAGDVTGVTVIRDGVEHAPNAVLVDRRYAGAPSAHLDAAVLVMDRPIRGPGATLGDTLPTQGLVTVAGFQPMDTDGSLLRGTSSHDHPTPKGVTGGVIEIVSLPTGCTDPASSVQIAVNQLTVGCGLVPGASGGGLFVEHGHELVLLGIISTVSDDLSSNGLTPLAAVQELLNHPGEYTQPLAEERDSASPPPITRR
jgi:hypothetical protein